MDSFQVVTTQTTRLKAWAPPSSLIVVQPLASLTYRQKRLHLIRAVEWGLLSVVIVFTCSVERIATGIGIFRFGWDAGFVGRFFFLIIVGF